MPNDNYDHDEQPILSLIQQIKDGTLNPKTLSKEIRQRCVDYLLVKDIQRRRLRRLLCVVKKP